MTKDRELLERIFSDAGVIDVDFSMWDKWISLCVVADHVAVPTPRRLPLFAVDFVGVRSFDCSFHHQDVQLDKPDHHFQWNIDECRISNIELGVDVRLSGSTAQPRLHIVCETIRIRELPNSVVDRVNPGWNKPYGPLARPGIEMMSQLLRGRKGDGGQQRGWE